MSAPLLRRRVEGVEPVAGGRLRATLRCRYCGWRIQMTGDDSHDIADFAAPRLLDHMTTLHADELERDPDGA